MESGTRNSRQEDDVVIIRRLALDADGRLRVYPSGGDDYALIWREAMSVRWDKNDRSLYVLPVKYFTTVDDLNQIIKAVREGCGMRLVIDETTVFDMPEEVASELRRAANG